MDFLNTQEKARLQKILAKSSKLQTAAERIECLTMCSLRNYCSSIPFDQSTDKFVSSLIVQLSKFEISSENSKKIGLVVLLEYITEFDELDFSPEEQNFIQYVINKWEQSKKQSSVPKNSQQQSQSTSSQSPIPTQVNREHPVSNRLKPAVQTKTNNRPNPPVRRQQNIAQPSVDRARYTTTIIGKKIWFILVFIVIIWSVVGYFSQSLINNGPSNQMLSALIICGFLGGVCSGLLGGWLALKLVTPSIQLETSLIYSAIEIVGGAIGWIIVGMLTYNFNLLQEYGQLIGFMFGLLIVVVIFGWLNLIRHRV